MPVPLHTDALTFQSYYTLMHQHASPTTYSCTGMPVPLHIHAPACQSHYILMHWHASPTTYWCTDIPVLLHIDAPACQSHYIFMHWHTSPTIRIKYWHTPTYWCTDIQVPAHNDTDILVPRASDSLYLMVSMLVPRTEKIPLFTDFLGKITPYFSQNEDFCCKKNHPFFPISRRAHCVMTPFETSWGHSLQL